MIYFTSDLHLGHANIIKYDDRPFTNIIEMDNNLINNINKVVKTNDELYILGDFAFANKLQTNNYLDKINCKNVTLIKGNHDTPIPITYFIDKHNSEINKIKG